MYSSVKPPLDKFYVSNQNAVDIKLYIVVHGYGSTDPVPGGCNMEFQPSISPYLHTSYTNDYVLVEAASARDSSDIACTSINDVNVVFYLMYLEERNFDSDTYFEGIKSMLTLDNITDNAEIVPQTTWRMRRMLGAYPGTGAIFVAVAYSALNSSAYSVYVPTYSYACSPLEESCELLGKVPQTTWRMRRMLGAYPGTGAIFVAVAYSALNSSAYSVYVPTYSYACSPLEESCELLDDVLSQLLCASLLFFGMFVCYFGHRFFKTEMFLIGLVSGVIITYILISLIAELERPALLGAAILSGTCFGFIWLLFWWFYGIPVFAVLLSTLNLGFLFAALMYFGLPGGFQALQVDFNFWTLFVLIMSITSLILLSTTFLSNILCCAILGGYATVYPIDYYIGSNLKYIIINTVRRAVVPKFNSAVLSPPFQWADTLITFLWLSLATTGFLFQHYQNRRKPPFPPPPRSIRPSVPDTTYGTTGRRYRDILQRPATSERRQTEYTPLLS
ncbi:Transmembrane 7 superfamily member 3 [Papilio machaon]|uniref:Transmembrane 7 superfamily member 3 n=1 Tax=Papilio machaon TaxID=76193 RepID=A0A194R7F1_PAPMA|nr:Transmembrane 7 superfamily member 3 [Papilio machaon]